MDGFGTINPADLNTSASLPSSNTGSPRGQKRPLTPERLAAIGQGGDTDDKPRKRGRQTKGQDSPVGPNTSVQPSQMSTPTLTQESPLRLDAVKSTPTTKNVKALPSVRDHTTDQLNPEGDEYIPREVDESGEKKVTPTGHLTGGRAYRCRTFFVPNRGNKLFMLATECARVLNYRDSYLLFNKNRSLFKIIASQPEKDDLIHQEILPYAYRSRQIAIVTARSMFRQFGARVIVNGKRVRDDYWETKARKQGFTEDDLAGEKRPGVSKGKEPAQVELTSTGASALNTLQRGEIVYRNQGDIGMGMTFAPSYPLMPMTDDMMPRDYGNIQRPRQDPSGTPYEDHTMPSAPSEIINQAATAAQFNASLRQQRNIRQDYLTEAWHREHKVDEPSPMMQAAGGAEEAHAESQPAQQIFPSPQLRQMPSLSTPNQSSVLSHQQSMSINQQQGYARPQIPQANLTSPMQISQPPLPQNMPQRTPNYTYGTTTPAPQQMYGYPQNMWPPQAQIQPSPIQQQPPHQFPQYGHPQQQQPRQQQSPHPTQSPHHAGQPQMPMMYQNMAGMGQPPPTPGTTQQQQQAAVGAYAGMRGYAQPGAGSPQQQQYMQQSQAGQQAGLQAWMGQNPQGWPGHGY